MCSNPTRALNTKNLPPKGKVFIGELGRDYSAYAPFTGAHRQADRRSPARLSLVVEPIFMCSNPTRALNTKKPSPKGKGFYW